MAALGSPARRPRSLEQRTRRGDPEQVCGRCPRPPTQDRRLRPRLTPRQRPPRTAGGVGGETRARGPPRAGPQPAASPRRPQPAPHLSGQPGPGERPQQLPALRSRRRGAGARSDPWRPEVPPSPRGPTCRPAPFPRRGRPPARQPGPPGAFFARAPSRPGWSWSPTSARQVTGTPVFTPVGMGFHCKPTHHPPRGRRKSQEPKPSGPRPPQLNRTQGSSRPPTP